MDFGLTGLIPRFFKRLASHRSKAFSACFMPHVRGQEHSWRSAVVDCILIETGKNVGVATRFNCKDFPATALTPRHHVSSLEAAQPTRSVPHAHYFRPLQMLIQD